MTWCSFLKTECTSYITNGYCRDEFPASETTGSNDGKFRITYCGNFCGGPSEGKKGRVGLAALWRAVRKRIEFAPRDFDRLTHSPKFLLDAIKELCEEDSSIKERLRFVHIGPSSPANKNYVDKLGLEENVEFLGFLDHTDAVAHIRRADALFFCLADSPTGERNDCIPQRPLNISPRENPCLR